MLMTTSQLVYRECRTQGSNPVISVVPLHSEGGDLTQLIPLCAALDPRCRIVAPQAAWRTRAMESGLREASGLNGYCWYRLEEPRRPEPKSFEAALWQVEQFIRDVMERRIPGEFRPILVGYRQGAVLALAAANRWPEMLTGVVVICGELPSLLSQLNASGDLTGLPILLVHDPDEGCSPRTRTRSIVASLRRQGAIVQAEDVGGVAGNPGAAVTLLKDWTDECLATTFRTDFNWEIGA
jgi:predicted esterase